MTIWVNSDNLAVKFGRDEAGKVVGGEKQSYGGLHVIEFDLTYTECVATAASIVGTIANPGCLGVWIPKGLIIDEIKTIATTAFTSSGTIGTSTMVLTLLKANDRTSNLSANTLTTSAFVGSVFDALGETTTLTPGSTGAGTTFGVAVSEDAIVACANSQHASHPYTAGVLRVRILGHFGTDL